MDSSPRSAYSTERNRRSPRPRSIRRHSPRSSHHHYPRSSHRLSASSSSSRRRSPRSSSRRRSRSPRRSSRRSHSRRSSRSPSRSPRSSRRIRSSSRSHSPRSSRRPSPRSILRAHSPPRRLSPSARSPTPFRPRPPFAYKTLIIRNLPLDPRDCTKYDFMKRFERYGKVTSVQLPKDLYSGKLRGFGYVEFDTIDEAILAKEKMHNANIGGRSIRTDFVRDPTLTFDDIIERVRQSGHFKARRGQGRDPFSTPPSIPWSPLSHCRSYSFSDSPGSRRSSSSR